jgi:hypothetical protein
VGRFRFISGLRFETDHEVSPSNEAMTVFELDSGAVESACLFTTARGGRNP